MQSKEHSAANFAKIFPKKFSLSREKIHRSVMERNVLHLMDPIINVCIVNLIALVVNLMNFHLHPLQARRDKDEKRLLLQKNIDFSVHIKAVF